MDTITVSITPAVIDTNYEAIRSQLQDHLAKYTDVVVTTDTLADSKKLATSINKLKGDIAATRKKEVSRAAEPVKAFEAKFKGLEEMCETVRQKIKTQVDIFEAKALNTARLLLEQLLAETYAKKAIQEEFQTATVEDDVKLSALTSTGKLSKAAKDSITAKVGECQVRQQRVALRLSQLENESHRVGLHSTLTREHVAGFLFDESDDNYNSNLSSLLEREIDRQEETLRRAEEQRKRDELLKKPAPGGAIPEVEPPAAVADPAPASIPDMPPIADTAPPPTYIPGTDVPMDPVKQTFSVTVTLRVNPPPGVTVAQVEAALRKKLAAAGVNDSVHSIITTVLA